MLYRSLFPLAVAVFVFGCEVDNRISGHFFHEDDNKYSYSIETQANGEGTTIAGSSLELLDTLTIYSVKRNSGGEFLENAEVSWQLSGGIGSLAISGDNRSATFTASSAGSGSISFTIDGNMASMAITVLQGSLYFLSQPSSTNVGGSIGSLITVEVRNSVGTLQSGYNGNVNLEIGTDPVGFSHLAGRVVVAAKNGVARFSKLYIDEVGTGYTLKARDENSREGISDPFNISSGPVIIYRSVGPGSTAALVTGGATNKLTISSGFANFSTALADNIGVGDVIQYDSDSNSIIDSIAIIQGRLSSTKYKVKKVDGASAASSVADASTWSICRAYTSLSNANSQSENTTCLDDNLVENFDTSKNLTIGSGFFWNIVTYADAVDSTASISGWTTSATQFLRIFAPEASSMVGISQRHNGAWQTSDTSAYKIAGGGGSSTLTISSPNVIVDGLQIQKTGTSGSDQCGIRVDNGTSGFVNITSNLIRGLLGNTNSYHQGILFWGGSAGTANIVNNVIFDFVGTTTDGGLAFCRGDTAYLYNNTVYNSYYGLWNDCGGGTNRTLKNNLIQATTIGYRGNPWDNNSDYNLSAQADAPGANSVNSATVSFEDSANYNFRLASSDTSAKNAGTDLSNDTYFPFLSDVIGALRGMTNNWDIGAYDSE